MNRDAKLFNIKDRTFAFLNKYVWRQKKAILAGILIGTTYVPFRPWALLFCLVPLWLEILENQEGFWAGFLRGWWTQAVLSAIGFYWIAYVSHEFGYMPWPVALAVLLLFVATVHTYFAVATGLVQWLRPRLKLNAVSSVLLLAFLTAAGEMAWPSLFPWNFGYTFLWVNSPIAQTADVFGFLGLSLIVLLSNALVTWAVHRQKQNGKYRWVLGSALAIAIIFGALHFWGESKRQDWQATDSRLNVIQVQANIGNFEKVAAEKGFGFEQSVVNQYFSLTRDALKRNPSADLIIWPETAFPDFLNEPELQNRPYAKQFSDFLREINKPVLTGAFSHVFRQKGSVKNYNALFLYGPDLHVMGAPYHKTDLLVFGEYTPLTDYFPALAKISPAGEGWNKGTGPQVLPFHDFKIGPQICYESLYPEFSAELANLGADVLINLTNDSWFGPTAESYQHMIMTLGRGMETRRPLLRSTNTGITTAILADGTQLQRSPQFEPWSDDFLIPFKKNAEITFYTRYHAWLPGMEFLMIFLILGLAWIKRNRKIE